MATKRAVYDVASFKALPDSAGDKGQFEALVSVFGNVDVVGDRVMPGAFAKSLAKWQERGDPIPIIWSHDWGNPQAHIGAADPHDVEETKDGLKVKGRLDMDNPFAAQVFRLLKERRVREFSFGYRIDNEKTAKDGANELLDLDLIEAGPTLKGANPETELLSVKADLEAAAAAPVISNNVISGESDGIEFDGKAGRRISRATESELSAAIDGMEKELSRLRGLLSAGDSEKQDEEEEDIAGKSTGEEQSTADDDTTDNSEPDFELLLIKTRIERMRD